MDDYIFSLVWRAKKLLIELRHVLRFSEIMYRERDEGELARLCVTLICSPSRQMRDARPFHILMHQTPTKPASSYRLPSTDTTVVQWL